MRLLTGCAVMLLAACTSTGVVPADGDTFMIGKKSAQAGFGPPIKTEAAVFAEASEFCDGQGKEVETADLLVRNSTFGRPGSVNLKFRCVDPGTSTAYSTPTDTGNDSNATENAASEEDTVNADDIYSKLVKLEELRKQGILTDEEFAQEKKELLDAN